MSWTTDHPEPSVPQNAGVLVEIKAVSLNPVDYKLADIPVVSGQIQGRPVSQDFSGVVIQSSSDKWKVGDAVFGFAKNGALAERILARDDAIAHKPAGMSFAEAACIPTTYLTSLQVLRGIGVQKGSKVVVAGASGGCGLAGIELARAMVGPEGTVAGICSGKNMEFVKSLNLCDLVIDYTKAEELQPQSSPLNQYKFDALYDTVTSPDAKDTAPGGISYDRAIEPFLTPSAKVGAINGGATAWISALTGFQKLTTCWSRYQLFLANPNTADLEEILRLHQAGGYKCIIDSLHPFDDHGIATAFERLKSRRARGKICIDVKDASSTS